MILMLIVWPVTAAIAAWWRKRKNRARRRGMAGMTPGMRLLLQLPYALGLLATFVVGFAIIAWRSGYWGPARRAYYSLFALMALLVVAFLVRWNYLPPVWR